MDISGYVVLGIVALFVVYLVPHLIRSRQDAVDARLNDRFSTQLRILPRSGEPGAGERTATEADARRAFLHRPPHRTEPSDMHRPIAHSPLPSGPQGTNHGESALQDQTALRSGPVAGRPPAPAPGFVPVPAAAVSYTHLRAHET